MIGKLLDALTSGKMPSEDTIKQAAAWADLQQQAAIEDEQRRVLQQMYFYETPQESLCTPTRSMSIEFHRCNDYLSELNVDSFQFNAFEASQKLGRKGLSRLTLFLVCSANLPEVLNLDIPKLQHFLEEVERGYRDVPYHNRVHIIDVVQRFHAIAKHVSLTPEERLAGYMAAVVHDYGHGGVTNNFLVATENVIARRYNNRSPWENFHVSQSLELLRSPENRFVPKNMLPSFKDLVVHLVLATDMSRHVEMLRTGGKAFQLTLALKCADVGHCGAPSDLHVRWSAALQNELKLQGRLERDAGLSETWVAMQDSQLPFFDVIIIPMFRSLVDAAPQTRALLDQAVVNRDLYS